MPVPYTKDLLKDQSDKFGYEVGNYSYGNLSVLNYGAGKKLFVGNYCSFGAGVTIFLDGNHRSDWVTTYPFTAIGDTWPEAIGIPGHPQSNGDVRIGSDVWIGQAATIMSGVTIGDGAVISALALVTKDVPPYAVVGGNPAKFLKWRFPENIRNELEAIAWWNWSEQEIKQILPYLVSSDIDMFLVKAKELKKIGAIDAGI